MRRTEGGAELCEKPVEAVSQTQQLIVHAEQFADLQTGFQVQVVGGRIPQADKEQLAELCSEIEIDIDRGVWNVFEPDGGLDKGIFINVFDHTQITVKVGHPAELVLVILRIRRIQVQAEQLWGGDAGIPAVALPAALHGFIKKGAGANVRINLFKIVRRGGVAGMGPGDLTNVDAETGKAATQADAQAPFPRVIGKKVGHSPVNAGCSGRAGLVAQQKTAHHDFFGDTHVIETAYLRLYPVFYAGELPPVRQSGAGGIFIQQEIAGYSAGIDDRMVFSVLRE